MVFATIDVTGWPRLNTEQMGTKPKFWCRDAAGDEFLFKESRAHGGENWSEKIAAEIAAALGLPHAAIELAVCDGRNGTLSKSFLSGSEESSLIHGNELLLEHDPTYPSDAPNFRVAEHTLPRIFRALSEAGVRLPLGFPYPPSVDSACDLFVGYLLLDALIANTDRHHANWAIIMSLDLDPNRFLELAPTFDHASSLGRELRDELRLSKLKAEAGRMAARNPPRRDQTVVGYLESDKGRSRIYAKGDSPKPLHPLQVFRLAWELSRAAGEAWLDRLASLQPDCFEGVLAHVPVDVMSQPAREFSRCLLRLNREALTSRAFLYA